MPDWPSTTLGAVLERPESGMRPTGGADSDSGEIPSFGGENILAEGGVLYEPVKRVPRSFYLRMQRGVLRDRDVLINKDGAQTGKVGLYRSSFYPEACINEHLFILRANCDQVDHGFLYHLLNSETAQRSIRPFITGSAQAGLKASFVDCVSFGLPKKDEQRAIAAILDAADEAIAKTEALIAKLKAIKQGLLHDLLTRGLDDNGELRDPERHPEQFKSTGLGFLPKGWRVATLGELASNRGDYGSNSAALPYTPYLPRYVRITDLTDDGRLNPLSLASITADRAKPYVLEEGDLLFARSGATVGKTYLYSPEDGLCAYAGYLIKFTLNRELCRPQYVAQWARSPMYWSLVKGAIKQAAQPNINADQYRRFVLPCPKLEEQGRIATALTTQDQRIYAEERFLSKLKAIKKGLMQDLLTGRVRVPAGKVLAPATG